MSTFCLLISNFSYVTNTIHKSQTTKPTLVHTSLHYIITKKKKGIHKATNQSVSHQKNKNKNWPVWRPLHMVHSDHWERQKVLTSTAHQSSNKTKYLNKAKISVKWESQSVRERERGRERKRESKIPILKLSSISRLFSETNHGPRWLQQAQGQACCSPIERFGHKEEAQAQVHIAQEPDLINWPHA